MQELDRIRSEAPRRLQVARITQPHPSLGGSRGYSSEFRSAEMTRYIRNERITCCKRTVQRWIRRFEAFKSTGNKRILALSGEYQQLLLIFRRMYPKATADEVRQFIFSHANVPKVFTREDICVAELRLGLTRKVGSTTALQALLPRNLRRRHLFWTQPPPLGVAGVPIDELIDLDECSVELETANRNHGKAFVNVRVREAGNYSQSEKWTLILAIDARNGGFKHIRFTHVPGTTKEIFVGFIRGLLARLPPGERRTFMWDNLSSHYSDEVYVMILAAGHRIVPRPPYRPVDGPIEYVFNTFELELRKRCYNIRTDAQLHDEVLQILANLNNFRNTFQHCGY